MSQSICLVFDPHCWPHKRHGGALQCGINRRGQLCLDVLQRAIQTANQHDAELIVAGDLVDSAGPVQPQFAAALRDTLAGCRGGVHLVLGNHDMTADGDHSLGLYERLPQNSVDEYTLVHDRHWWINDCAWVNSPNGHATWGSQHDLACLVPFNCDIRDERIRDVPLLVAHFGVYDDSFPPWLRQSKGAWHVDALFAFMKERNIGCICVGDWHSRKIWFSRGNGEFYEWKEHNDVYLSGCEQVIMQGGALCPTGWDNPGLTGYGTVALWDGERLSWQELPGPRFCVARSAEEEAELIKNKGENKLFLRRYYLGERPPTPEGLEAYELLPVKAEQVAQRQLDMMKQPREQLQQLVSLWLDVYDGDAQQMAKKIEGYVL